MTHRRDGQNSLVGYELCIIKKSSRRIFKGRFLEGCRRKMVINQFNMVIGPILAPRQSEITQI